MESEYFINERCRISIAWYSNNMLVSISFELQHSLVQNLYHSVFVYYFLRQHRKAIVFSRCRKTSNVHNFMFVSLRVIAHTFIICSSTWWYAEKKMRINHENITDTSVFTIDYWILSTYLPSRFWGKFDY